MFEGGEKALTNHNPPRLDRDATPFMAPPTTTASMYVDACTIPKYLSLRWSGLGCRGHMLRPE